MSFTLPPLYTLPAYFIGTSLVGLGLTTLRQPRAYYEIFGIPATSSISSRAPPSVSADKSHPAANNSGDVVSPFVYVKAARDIVFGACLVAFQATGNEDAVNIWVGTMTIAAVIDGWVVWNWGREKFRPKAWGHWIGGGLGIPWVAWRLQNL